MGKRSAVLVSAALPMLLVAAPAGARPAAHSAEFVGGYTMKLDMNGSTYLSRLTVRANGSCTDASGGVPSPCTWSNKGSKFTLVATGLDITLVGTKSPKGISSKAHPGTAYLDGSPYGTWYAVAETS